jgi:hypothetical protein
VGICLVGLPLGFEFGAESGDIEDSFISSLLEAVLAVGFDGFDFAFSDGSCLLEAVVTVIVYGRQVCVKFT